MKLFISPVIEDFGDLGFIASLPNLKGMVAVGNTAAEAKQELIKSLEVKIAYDYGLEIV